MRFSGLEIQFNRLVNKVKDEEECIQLKWESLVAYKGPVDAQDATGVNNSNEM